MIEIEGIVAGPVTARDTDRRGDMILMLALSPWRRIGSTEAEPGVVHVEIAMDFDLTDAWMSLDPGAGVRIECASLEEVDGEMRASGMTIHDAPTLDAAGVRYGLN